MNEEIEHSPMFTSNQKTNAMNSEQEKGMKKIIITFGIIGGIIISFMLIGSTSLWGNVIDYEVSELVGYATMLIAMSTIFVGIKKHRDTNLGGIISFGKAFKVGILITLITSLIYVITWMIIMQFSPDIMDGYFQVNVDKIQNSGETQEVIQKKLNEMNNYKELYKNPFVKFGITFLEIFPVGLLITLISALILKRK